MPFYGMADQPICCAQMRELKSIPLDVTCQFIKIRFHQNHINHLNPFNQVCVCVCVFQCVHMAAAVAQWQHLCRWVWWQ